MDLLRLALERGATARAAVGHLTSLLEEHGQGGACEEGGDWTYENGFLLADAGEAFVVETAGTRHWAVERVPPGKGRNISNGLSIRTGVESCSAGLKELCVAKARASPLPLLTAALHAAPLARRLPCRPGVVGRRGPLRLEAERRRGREGAREARRARARAGGRRPPRRRRGPRVGRLAPCRRRGGLAGLDGGRVARRGERHLLPVYSRLHVDGLADLVASTRRRPHGLALLHRRLGPARRVLQAVDLWRPSRGGGRRACGRRGQPRSVEAVALDRPRRPLCPRGDAAGAAGDRGGGRERRRARRRERV
mmetsp:Transcript_7985/g.23567  ORF Transcript_7985/g.23567 Transcript_7985/m.23567 type:complete len:309 (-) Transcript_7985:1252-2178(-)